MVNCDKCGQDVNLPFRCNYCGGYYCSNHRLPEFHDCTGLHKWDRTPSSRRESSYRVYDTYYHTPKRKTSWINVLNFSNRELRHLAISLLLISSMPFFWLRTRKPLIVIGAVCIFAAAFLLHELAHKFSAQMLGYWAEFRLNPFGLLITLFSFFSPIKLVAPGAVIISGLMHGDDYGKISLAGPMTNITQALIFLFLSQIFYNQNIRLLCQIGIIINSSLALFNLIPFGLFDGVKVLKWNWKIWSVTVITAILLFVYSAF